MVIRSWEGTAKEGAGDRYLAYLTEAMLGEIRAVPGCLGVRVLRRTDDPDHFVIQSHWTDVEAIGRFAGPDPELAVVPMEARELLADYEHRARHFDVAADLFPDGTQ